MDQYIKKLQSYSFSNVDMMNLVEGKANFLTYPKLKNFSTIDKVLGNFGACIILYLSDRHYGHWTCIFKRSDIRKPTLEFFDSYGYMMDDELFFNTKQKNISLGQDRMYLTKLVRNSRYDLVYNSFPLQKLIKNDNVCGRWVGMRLQFRDLSLDKFVNLFKDNKCYNGDWLITAMSCFIH